MYRGYFAGGTWKVIIRINGIESSLFAVPTWQSSPRGTSPNFAWNVGGWLFSAENLQHLWKGEDMTKVAIDY